MPEKEKPEKDSRCVDWRCYGGDAKWCKECTPERQEQCKADFKAFRIGEQITCHKITQSVHLRQDVK